MGHLEQSLWLYLELPLGLWNARKRIWNAPGRLLPRYLSGSVVEGIALSPSDSALAVDMGQLARH